MSLILDGTKGLSDVDGTAGTPAIRGSDANTGVFFGTDIVGVSTGGSERMRVDASGNVGIGTSSPEAKLSVLGGTTSGTSFNTAVFAGGSTNTSGSGAKIYLSGSPGNGTTRAAVIEGVATNGNNAHALAFYTNTDFSAPAERARIDSSGNLLVGKTSENAALAGFAATPSVGYRATTTSGNFNICNTASASGTETLIQFRYSDTPKGGISCNGTTVSYNTSSDYRLKHDIQPMTGALAKVVALKPCTYKWNADDSSGEGFIAHELQEVCPSAVTGEKDAVNEDGSIKPQGIDTSFLVATLTAAIQEQQAIIESLTARVVALEGQA